MSTTHHTFRYDIEVLVGIFAGMWADQVAAGIAADCQVQRTAFIVHHLRLRAQWDDRLGPDILALL